MHLSSCPFFFVSVSRSLRMSDTTLEALLFYSFSVFTGILPFTGARALLESLMCLSYCPRDGSSLAIPRNSYLVAIVPTEHLEPVLLTCSGSDAQEVTVPLSGYNATPGTVGTMVKSPGSSPFEAALDGAAPLSARLRSTPRTYSEAGDLSPRAGGPLMGAMWQEVEEISCPLTSLIAGPPRVRNHFSAVPVILGFMLTPSMSKSLALLIDLVTQVPVTQSQLA
jgi:hypothetical protein